MQYFRVRMWYWRVHKGVLACSHVVLTCAYDLPPACVAQGHCTCPNAALSHSLTLSGTTPLSYLDPSPPKKNRIQSPKICGTVCTATRGWACICTVRCTVLATRCAFLLYWDRQYWVVRLYRAIVGPSVLRTGMLLPGVLPYMPSLAEQHNTEIQGTLLAYALPTKCPVLTLRMTVLCAVCACNLRYLSTHLLCHRPGTDVLYGAAEEAMQDLKEKNELLVPSLRPYYPMPLVLKGTSLPLISPVLAWRILLRPWYYCIRRNARPRVQQHRPRYNHTVLTSTSLYQPHSTNRSTVFARLAGLSEAMDKLRFQHDSPRSTQSPFIAQTPFMDLYGIPPLMAPHNTILAQPRRTEVNEGSVERFVNAATSR
eukprot:2767074-Rhodomonas_salina.1